MSGANGGAGWSWLQWSHASWERHLAGGPGLDFSCSERTLATWAWETASRHPTRLAVSIEGDSRSFAELRDAGAVVAGWLRERVSLGDRVLLVAPTSVAWVEVYLGALAAGAAVVLGNPSSSAHELAQLVHDSGAAVVILDG
ncbi:MAG: AMP-binding protein, partial [Lapillicoccus sp.]